VLARPDPVRTTGGAGWLRSPPIAGYTPAEMARKVGKRAASTSRGPLSPARVTDGFRAFVLEQLSEIESVLARAMFGGVGLYAGGVFFGILAADTLYLKVDDSNRGQYEAEGMTAFRPYADKPMTMSYYQVPARVLEDRDELTAWVGAAVRVAASASPRTARR
jgi:DNA transformation protein